MDFFKGMVVVSRAGHDSGRFMIVTAVDESFVYVADGKERKLEKPKRKNPLHLSKTKKSLAFDELTNKKLRTALREYNADTDIAEESD